MTTGVGPRPWWNGVGFGLAMAVVIAFLVVLYVPPSPVPDDGAPPTTTARTITLDDLEAMLTNDTPQTPPVVVETPDGPATVIVPSTQPPATTTPATSSTTTSTTTSTTVPVQHRPPGQVADDILDDLIGEQTPTTTIPEGAGGDT